MLRINSTATLSISERSLILHITHCNSTTASHLHSSYGRCLGLDLRIDLILDVSRRRALTRHWRSGRVESEEGSEVERREMGEDFWREEGEIGGRKGNGCTGMKVYDWWMKHSVRST